MDPVVPRTIAWIGLGVMGRAMAGHLLGAGHRLVVHTRTAETATELLGRGASWADTPADAARDADVVGVMVGTPDDVAEVVLGPDGVLSTARPGTLLVDFTTSRPTLATEIADAASRRGVAALDAPVSGGDIGARDATLSIMVGGDADAVANALPVLQLLGRTVVHQGPAGSGQHTKMVNQILIAGTMGGLAESLTYARAAGLDPERVLDSVATGAAASWALTHLAPRALAGDAAPGFAVDHFVKDLGIAVDEADRMGLELPTLALARRLYDRLAEDGGGRLGTQALVEDLARRHGIPPP